MKKLNAYSERFAEILFQAFPEWKEFSTVETENETDADGYLLVKIPAPAKGLLPDALIPPDADFLNVYPSDDEITVAFDYFHEHFDSFVGENETENFKESVEFIQLILNEKICPVVVLNGIEWCGSTSIDAGEKPDLSDWNFLSSDCQDVYVRSWRGKYNRKYNVQECLKKDPFSRPNCKELRRR